MRCGGHIPVFLLVTGILIAPQYATAGNSPASLPSVQNLFGESAFGGVALSPTGRYIAVVVPIKSERALAVLDLRADLAAQKVSLGKPLYKGDVAWVEWQTDQRLIFGLRGGGVTAINRDGSDERSLRITQVLRLIPGTTRLLAGGRDVVSIDSESPHGETISWPNPGNIVRWVIDFDGVPRAAVQADVNQDRSAWYVRKSANDPWIEVDHAKLGRLDAEPMAFDPSGSFLYVSARRNGDDRVAIYEYHIANGTWKGPIVRHPVRDIGTGDAIFIADFAKRKLLGLRYADDKPAVVWFDPEWAGVQKSVDAALPETVNAIYHAGDQWLVVAYSDRDPGAAYLLDGKSRKLEKLFSYRPWIDPKAMAPMRWVTYKARDGMTIPALLTVPLNASGKPVPLIVDIHGGPYVEATRWGYSAEVQFLASRGYAVLQPQFRGTMGFGWKLESSGFRRWGDEMQDDLEDGVQWAVENGVADPAHVCYFGWSYGGYAAIWEAIKDPKLIRCSVAISAVTSLDYLFDNAQTDLSQLADRSTYLSYEVGDPKTDRTRFKRVSPLDHADTVGVPLLLAYGVSDRRVPIVHGNDFRSALDKFHRPYEWVAYPDGDHNLSRKADQFDLYGRIERFLAMYLGPENGNSLSSPQTYPNKAMPASVRSLTLEQRSPTDPEPR